MNFLATRVRVKNRGIPPESFLTELVLWGRSAPADIFAPNPNPDDVYARVKAELGPWQSLLHRRAVMLEVMRVQAGFESSWNWNEGVDRTNRTSMAHLTGQEAGPFQVSFDSEWLGHAAMKPFAQAHSIDTPETFIAAMKNQHDLALGYYARLVRISIAWAGPIVRNEINPWLSRASVAEFQSLLQ